MELARRAPPVVFVATARPSDAEMKRRIREHRRNRPAWPVVFAGNGKTDFGRLLRQAARLHRPRTILLDSLGLWLASRLRSPKKALEELENMLAWFRGEIGHGDAPPLPLRQRGGGRWIVVSDEVGDGIVPTTKSGRAFRDLVGEANQRLAAAADEVWRIVAGIPVRLK